VLNQPANVCPALVGVAGIMPISVPGVLDNVAVAGVPPLPLNVSVTGFTVHLAQYGVFTLGTMDAEVNCVPPVAALVLNQPTNVWPTLVGFTGIIPIVVPGILDKLVIAGVPLLPLNVKVTGFAVHLAQYVVLLLGTVELAVNCTPPVVAFVLNQPTNVWPALVGLTGIVPIIVPGILDNVVVAGVPLLPLKVKVTGFAVHRAQYVVLLLGTVELVVNCVPPVAALVLNQPTNVCPTQDGFGGIVPIVVPGTRKAVAVVGVPPLPLKVRVISPAWVTVMERDMCVPGIEVVIVPVLALAVVF